MMKKRTQSPGQTEDSKESRSVLFIKRLCRNSKKSLNSGCHAGLDPASRNVKTLILHWIPGQARNDKTGESPPAEREASGNPPEGGENNAIIKITNLCQGRCC
jgi:hypothetical protein